MGKDKENELVDESSEESFPASDPPSWTASPPPVTPSSTKKEGSPLAAVATQASKARELVRRAARVPSNLFLLGGLAMAGTSLGLMAGGRKHASLLAAIAVPSILLVGLYQQLAGARPTDPYRPDLH